MIWRRIKNLWALSEFTPDESEGVLTITRDYTAPKGPATIIDMYPVDQFPKP